MTTGCQVAAAKIRNGDDAGLLGDDVGVAELQCIWSRGIRSVPYGLAVRSQGRNCCRRNAFARKQGLCRNREILCNFHIESAEFVKRDVTIALGQREDALAQVFGIGESQGRMEAWLGVETCQGHIDAVSAGARDQAEVKRGRRH